MSLENLRCFLAAARAPSFRLGARTVGLTAAAFGQRIKQLEGQVGAALFVRTTRVVTLTPVGHALIPLAERCLQAAKDCESVARTPTPELPRMELTIGVRSELGVPWILRQRQRLTSAFSWLDVHLYFSAGPDLLLRLGTFDIDCAITAMTVTDPKLTSIQLYREDYLLVAARRLLAASRFSSPQDAASHTLVDLAPDLPLFSYWANAQRRGARFEFARRAWLGSVDAIRAVVRAGEGVAVLPRYVISGDLRRRRLREVFVDATPVSDHVRLVFRAHDPRRAIFATLAATLAELPP